VLHDSGYIDSLKEVKVPNLNNTRTVQGCQCEQLQAKLYAFKVPTRVDLIAQKSSMLGHK
jgi:hypothetical protein